MNITCHALNSTMIYKLPDGWLEFVVLFYVGGALLAVAGNSLVLVTVIRRPLLRRVSYYLVAALALEDLLQGAINGITKPQAKNEGCWPFGGAACVLFGFLSLCLVGVDLLLLVAITVDRYIACCMPLRYAVLVTVRRCKFVIAGCWIFPVILAVLPLIGCDSYHYVAYLNTCYVGWSNRPLAVGCMSILSGTTFLPCTIVIVICQIRIYKQVKKVTDQPLPQVARSGTSSAIVMVSSRPTKATLTVSLVTGIYFLCWVPFVGMRITKLFVEWNDIGIMSNLAICMLTVSKFSNPIVYGVYSREFRQECIKLFQG